MGGVLSMVGTPIGNMQDVSQRVVHTLESADTVLCEDTRVTGKLLSLLGVHTRLERCDANVLPLELPHILERLKAGERIAFVSDAGMPGISDPGQQLVDAAREVDLPVEVVPGPTASVAALVASGLPSNHFFFEGFLPRKGGAQRSRLEMLAVIPATLIVYESPRRVVSTLTVIGEVMADRQVALVRELTKVHEEVLRGTAQNLIETLSARDSLKGECVLVIAPPSEEEQRARAAVPQIGFEEALKQGLNSKESTSALAKRLAKTYGKPRSRVYELIVSVREKL